MTILPPYVPAHGLWCSGIKEAKICPYNIMSLGTQIANGGSAITSYYVEYTMDKHFNNYYTYKYNVPATYNSFTTLKMKFEVGGTGVWYFRVKSENINGIDGYCNKYANNENVCDGSEIVLNVVYEVPTEAPTVPIPTSTTTTPMETTTTIQATTTVETTTETTTAETTTTTTTTNTNEESTETDTEADENDKRLVEV